MELPDIGENCGISSCNMLDFLPIKCEFCLKIFCKNHSLPEYHNCKELPKKSTEMVSEKQTRHCCSLPTCSGWELTPVECSKCEKNFCLKHRHQVDHDCPAYVPPTNPMAEAAAKIQKLTDSLPSEPKKTKKVKNEKLAAKVLLMKLKGKAVGNDHLPPEERIFFSVSLPKSILGKGNNPLAVFVSHHWSLGKVLDAVAEMAHVPNHNNEIKMPQLRLYRSSNGVALMPLDAHLKDMLQREEVYNGQTLILEYSEKGSESLQHYDTYHQ